MALTVKDVATLSGVSVRTLHFYDEIGLFKPASVGENGYRYYDEDQLLTLQQILFLRELEVPLAEIQRTLVADPSERLVSLQAHKRLLADKVERLRTLLHTIDKTIDHLKGATAMAADELFEGFDPEQQARYEEEIKEKYGTTALDESKRRTAGYTKDDWTRSQQEAQTVGANIAAAKKAGLPGDHPEVQALVREHFNWINRFYTPTHEIYVGLGQLYVEDPRFRAFYDRFEPGLADYLAEAMRVFADRELV